MLALYTFMASNLVLLGTGFFFSEPFLLAMFGALLILTGDIIRQKGRQKQSSQPSKSSRQEETVATPLISSRTQRRVNARGLPVPSLRRDSVASDLVGTNQLWLPLSGSGESNEGNAEVVHH
jgi:hypothetical protein